MAAAPWFLLAGGIGLVILGFFVTALRGDSGPEFIDPKMSDKEIKRRMKANEATPAGNWIMLVGLVVVLGSIAWRIARNFI